MSEAITVALVTGGLTLIGTIITIIATNKQTISKLDKKSELSDEKIQGQIGIIETKIETLSERVQQHNQIIDRTYGLERRMAVAEERISDANHRINELRDDGK